jgi:hypothetical protein
LHVYARKAVYYTTYKKQIQCFQKVLKAKFGEGNKPADAPKDHKKKLFYD